MRFSIRYSQRALVLFAAVLLLLVPVFKRMLGHHRLIDPAAARRADADATDPQGA